MTDVQAVILERIAEIDSEIRRLKAALLALTGERRNRRRPKPRAASSPTRSKGPAKATRARPGERRNQVLAELGKAPGSRASEVAKSIGVSPNQVHAVIAKLRADKLVGKRGKGYGLATAAKQSPAPRTTPS